VERREKWASKDGIKGMGKQKERKLGRINGALPFAG